MTPTERLGVTIALASLLGAFLAPWIWERVDPEVRVAVQLGCVRGGSFGQFQMGGRPGKIFGPSGEQPLHPWGHPWVFDRVLLHAQSPSGEPTDFFLLLRISSAGPNGIDEHGKGDDVVLYERDERVPRGFKRPGLSFQLYSGVRETLFTVALVLPLLLASARKIRAPRPASASKELRVAAQAFLAAFAAAVLALVLVLDLAGSVFSLESSSSLPWLTVPWPLAIGGTACVALFLGILLVRSRFAPLEADAEPVDG